MKYFEPISENSIIDAVNRICGTTNESFPNKEKLAHISDALDMYFYLAAESAPQGSFDDTGNASAPIEKQDLVAGTNAYQVSDFTNKVLSLVRVSILNEDGKELELFYEDFDDTFEFDQLYSTDADQRGTPTYWTKLGDFIYLRPCPDYAETDGLRAYVARELVKPSFVTCTITEATPGVVTATAHGLSDGDAILLFTDGTLPTNLTKDTTIYYVSGKTADTFKLSTTPSDVGTTEVDTSGSVESGTHKFVKVSGEPGIPVIHHDYLARYTADKFMDTQHPKFQKNRADLVQDKIDIQDYWQAMNKMSKTIIETKRRRFK